MANNRNQNQVNTSTSGRDNAQSLTLKLRRSNETASSSSETTGARNLNRSSSSETTAARRNLNRSSSSETTVARRNLNRSEALNRAEFQNLVRNQQYTTGQAVNLILPERSSISVFNGSVVTATGIIIGAAALPYVRKKIVKFTVIAGSGIWKAIKIAYYEARNNREALYEILKDQLDQYRIKLLNDEIKQLKDRIAEIEGILVENDSYMNQIRREISRFYLLDGKTFILLIILWIFSLSFIYFLAKHHYSASTINSARAKAMDSFFAKYIPEYHVNQLFD